ncbi:hypothetical protein IFM89_011059 [Coptis chinensis]|uniref:Amidase domain-containing protein n=1 Tax=Coptis chinensis TaxID=261450 RepID=A0A835IN93_9MAGN|nr:hypothetical protein IFM89_011059 [Coptis chinensis]
MCCGVCHRIPELHEMRTSHIVAIGSEAKQCVHWPLIIRLDYIATARLRRRIMHYHMEIFKEVDILVTPTIGLLEKTLEFKDMKDLDSFTIGVNGLTIDFEFSKNDREKYYELYCTQDTFLHDNIKLAAGAICETIDFVDAIKASKLSTPQEDFAAWEKTLGVLDVNYLRPERMDLAKGKGVVVKNKFQ